jgi:DNA replication protein DnaC
MNKTMQARQDTRDEIAVFARALMLSSRVIELCQSEATPKQEQFLHRVLAEEIVRRERSRKSRLLKRAGFPVLKGFEGYQFDEIRFPPAFSREELLTGEFIREKKNLVLYGGVGTGNYVKSSLMQSRRCKLRRAKH